MKKVRIVDCDGTVVEEVPYENWDEVVVAQERRLAEIDAENEINWGCEGD